MSDQSDSLPKTPAEPLDGNNKIALLPLLIAVIICLSISIYPQILVKQNAANHGAASLLFWAMSAGFIRGVGFVPENKILRGLFSTYACLFGVAGAILIMLL
jgi:predicted membrane protein